MLSLCFEETELPLALTLTSSTKSKINLPWNRFDQAKKMKPSELENSSILLFPLSDWHKTVPWICDAESFSWTKLLEEWFDPTQSPLMYDSDYLSTNISNSIYTESR